MLPRHRANKKLMTQTPTLTDDEEEMAETWVRLSCVTRNVIEFLITSAPTRDELGANDTLVGEISEDATAETKMAVMNASGYFQREADIDHSSFADCGDGRASSEASRRVRR